MQPEIAFRLAFERYGAPYRVPSAEPVLVGAHKIIFIFLEKALRMQRKHIGPNGPIYFDFLDNFAFNALATSYDGKELITLYMGAVEYVFYFYFSFFSDPETLPSIGYARGECVAAEAIDVLRGRAQYHPDICLPKDEERMMAARCFAYLTCTFILLHEVGHIVRCHPAYLQTKYGAQTYEEIPISGGNRTADTNIRLAFEWEADEYGAGTSYQFWNIMRDSEIFQHIAGLEPNMVWSISAAMTFMIIAHFSQGNMASGSKTHPAPLSRFIWSVMSVEKSPSCQKFGPDFNSFMTGLPEVLGWFSRNNLGLNFGANSETLNVQQFAENMRDEHSLIHLSLQQELILLEQLSDTRLAAASKWCVQNNVVDPHMAL
jgi:hypothetical protein